MMGGLLIRDDKKIIINNQFFIEIDRKPQVINKLHVGVYLNMLMKNVEQEVNCKHIICLIYKDSLQDNSCESHKRMLLINAYQENFIHAKVDKIEFTKFV